MSVNSLSQFQRIKEKGWQRGLGNLLRGEYSAWFKSSRWWKQLLIWILIINGMMGIMLIATVEAAKDGSGGPPLLLMYGFFGGLTVAFGVMVVMQRVLVGEKKSGTAAWVLSKPVTRTAFVVSRLVVNSVAILLTSVIVPGVILYGTLGLFSDLGWLSPLGYLASLLMFSLQTLYWITLVLMLGTLFESSGIVIGIPIALFFTFMMGPGLIPSLLYISPLQLVYSPASEQFSPLSISFITGTPVFSWLPLITTVGLSIIFTAVSIWRFNRQQF